MFCTYMHLARTYNDDKNIQLHCFMRSHIKTVARHTNRYHQKHIPKLTFLLVKNASLTPLPHPQRKIHNNSCQKRQRQHRRPVTIINPRRPSLPNRVRPPVERCKGIQHSCHGDKCKEAGRNTADTVPEVEQTDGETAQDDGEVQPGEKSALVGEEDFWLDAGREGDSFAFICLLAVL